MSQNPTHDGSLPLTVLLIPLVLSNVFESLYAICSEKANLEIKCPVEPGDYTITQTVEPLKEIPPAKFGINANAYTKEDVEMLCLRLSVDFTHFPGGGLWEKIGVV